MPPGRLGALRHLEADVVVLVALEAAAERALQHRVAEAHHDAGVVAVEVGEVAVEHRADHLEGEGGLGVLVEGPHDAAHVDALLVGLERDRAGDRGLELDLAAVAGAEADRQAEVRDADVLDVGLGALDQAVGAVLEVGEGRDIGGVGAEAARVAAVERRIGGVCVRARIAVRSAAPTPGRLVAGPAQQRARGGLGLGLAGARAVEARRDWPGRRAGCTSSWRSDSSIQPSRRHATWGFRPDWKGARRRLLRVQVL